MTPSTIPARPSTRRLGLIAVAIGTIGLTGCGASSAPTPSTSPEDTTSVLSGAGRPSTTGGIAIVPAAAAPGADSRRIIDIATAALLADGDDTDALLTLGLSWYQHARETYDPSDYARADEAFARRLALLPDDPETIIGQGTVALARHRFSDALDLGTRARDLAPANPRAWGVVSDALVELGRYPEALDAVQHMVDLRPDLGSYSRVSYQRELRGDLDGAIDAMERAVIAGGPETENTEYVRVLLGNLWMIDGDLDHAEASYDASLEHAPGFVHALAGLARVRAARGDVDGAVELLQGATDVVPAPELLITLGELQEAAGRTTDARTTYDLVRDIESLFAANGVVVDLDLALFEADHGDPSRAVELARQAWTDTPTVRAADALGWALMQAGRPDEARPWAERALALGSVEPSYLFHAGLIADAQGDAAAARAWLGDLLDRDPGWSALRAPIARQTLARLTGTAEILR
jgi:tetratricopeptide (TPR) repeat protein